MSLHSLIENRLREAVTLVVPEADPATILVRPCQDPKFGDYQCAAILSLAQSHQTSPRKLAAEVLRRLDLSDCCEKVDLAGAGFINFTLNLSAVSHSLLSAATGEHLFFSKQSLPRSFVLDFSSPNVAKPMHVGHIRSTILGDALANALRLVGHHVITDNHLGDWGTQFGKLIVGWKRCLDQNSLRSDPIAELERLYKTITAACESDPGLLDDARSELVALQSGQSENLQLWQRMSELSQKEFETLYARLGVSFDYTLGESFYNPRLQGLVKDLVAKGIANESDGAIAIFFDDIPHLRAHPALIQKSDGGFNYMSTDLATLAFRLESWQPDEIIYVTDARQQLHFQQLFAAFQRWHPHAKVKLTHVWFGSILAEDGKPFKTRTGETIKLAHLLDEAEERAFRIVSEKSPLFSEPDRREIARVVGIGALKYADLLPNRQSDYVFSWDKMLALNGNTAPYLQYAYTRIRSIFRKAETGIKMKELAFSAEEEVALAKHLLNYGFSLDAMIQECRPNLLCNFLYCLAGRFTAFYEACPVLKSAEPVRSSRLILCDLSARVLRQGLSVLGIKTPEHM